MSSSFSLPVLLIIVIVLLATKSGRRLAAPSRNLFRPHLLFSHGCVAEAEWKRIFENSEDI
jgi:hypothetical protein